jgi:hypothetical protein
VVCARALGARPGEDHPCSDLAAMVTSSRDGRGPCSVTTCLVGKLSEAASEVVD